MQHKQQQYSRDDVVALEAQNEQMLLQAQLAEMRRERDKWQSRAERKYRRSILNIKVPAPLSSHMVCREASMRLAGLLFILLAKSVTITSSTPEENAC